MLESLLHLLTDLETHLARIRITLETERLIYNDPALSPPDRGLWTPLETEASRRVLRPLQIGGQRL